MVLVLATLKQVLDKANRGRYAVGAFNVNNLELLQGIVRAAEAERSPVILQSSEGALAYAGMPYLYALMKSAADQARVPVVIHLDHGRDLTVVKNAIATGYSSVMYDGSHVPFDENVRVTKAIVSLAHKNGVSVEGELGTIGGAEDKIESRVIHYTDPAQAVEFVEKTGVDALAIAIGTSHGAYKFKGRAKLDLARLKEIKRRLPMPIVLHGASSMPLWLINRARAAGVRLMGAQGVPESVLKKAVSGGVNKVNVDTDLRIAFTAAVRATLNDKPGDFDPRKYLGSGRDAIQEIVSERMRVLGSSGKA